MPRLNVRCCCQPQKILGTLDVPEWAVKDGHFTVLPSRSPGSLSFDANRTIRPSRVDRVEIREIVLGAHSSLAERLSRVPLPPMREFAVYSEERPIEFWRKVPGFREGDAV
jgi:hypothetical protein